VRIPLKGIQLKQHKAVQWKWNSTARLSVTAEDTIAFETTARASSNLLKRSVWESFPGKRNYTTKRRW